METRERSGPSAVAMPPSVPDDDRPAGVHPRSGTGRWAVAAGLVLVSLPVVVAVVRARARGSFPVGDDAMFAIRARDVFSSDPPLIGMFSSLSANLGFSVNNPGPLHFDLVALPVQLFGDDGVIIGVGLVNLVAIVGAVLVAARTGGPAVGTAAALGASVLAFGMGSELLIEAFPSHGPLLPFLCFLVLVWAVACADLVALPIAAAVASLVLQTHLSYGFLVPPLAMLAVTGLALDLWRSRREGASTWPRRRRQAGVSLLVTASVLAVSWVQPLVEQVTGPGTGNARRISQALGEPVDDLGPERGARLLARVFSSPPWELRGSLEAAPRALWVSVVVIALVAAALGLVLWTARRRQDRRLVLLAATGLVALGLGLVTASRVPVTAPLRTAFGIAPHHVLWMVALFGFVVFVLAAGLVRHAASVGLRPASGAVALLGIVAVVVACNLPTADQGAIGPRAAMAASRELGRQLDGVDFDGPVLVEAAGGFSAYGPVAMAELQRRGVAFRTSDEVFIRQLGPTRAFDGENADQVLTVKTGDEGREAPPGARRVAFSDGLTGRERDELDRLRQEIVELVDEERLMFLDASRLPRRADGAVDAEEAVLGQEVLFLVEHGLVEGDPQVDPQLRRYALLQRRANDATVTMFLGPLER